MSRMFVRAFPWFWMVLSVSCSALTEAIGVPVIPALSFSAVVSVTLLALMMNRGRPEGPKSVSQE